MVSHRAAPLLFLSLLTAATAGAQEYKPRCSAQYPEAVLTNVLHTNRESALIDALKQEAIVIEFGASWCAPCRAFTPVLRDVAAVHPEIAFYSVDTDDEADLSDCLRIDSLPTVLYIKDGTVERRQEGVPEGDAVAMRSYVENIIAAVYGARQP